MRRLFSPGAVIALITTGILFAAVQLSRFSTDASLSEWLENGQGYTQALALQRVSGKPIALFFHTDWCANCKKLRETVLSSPPMRSFVETRLIPVKINPEYGPAEWSIAKQFGVLGYPTFYIFSANPKQITPIRRTINVTPEEFVQECRQAIINTGRTQ